MIAHLTGRVFCIESPSLVIDVAGVGYRVYTTTSVISGAVVGSEISLATHFVVRENALELFGFTETRDVRFFELLLGVPGIGPRSALGILNLAPVDVLASAISRGDTSHLTKVSGIGTKSAQKIIVELKDKIGGNDLLAEQHAEDTDVIDALSALGYSLAEARGAINALPHTLVGTQLRLKEALKILNSRA